MQIIEGGIQMKKFSLLLLSLLLVLAMAACNSNDDSSTDTASNNDDTKTEEKVEPIEPTEEDTCAFCGMEILEKDDEMGQFTAEAITEDDEYIFFCDSGCLLNAPRKSGETYKESWVRDYYTLDWLKSDDAIIVHSDIATPMKYGYAFFSSQEDADTFTSDHADLNPTVVTWKNVDEVANERYQKKMQMQEQQNNSDESTTENSGH